jgi:hypothetical protein
VTGNEADAVWWPSPYGPGRCLRCHVRAAVVVTDVLGEQADLCWRHWHEAARRFGPLIRSVLAAPHGRTDG